MAGLPRRTEQVNHVEEVLRTHARTHVFISLSFAHSLSRVLYASIDQSTRPQQQPRQVLRCFVIGSEHCGKTTMVHKFIDSAFTTKPTFRSDGKPLSKVIESVNFIDPTYGSDKPKLLVVCYLTSCGANLLPAATHSYPPTPALSV